MATVVLHASVAALDELYNNKQGKKEKNRENPAIGTNTLAVEGLCVGGGTIHFARIKASSITTGSMLS